MNDIFENDYRWLKNDKYGEDEPVNLIPTELNPDKLDLFLAGMESMCGGWLFVLEQNGKECWVWFDEKNYKFIPIPKVDIPLSAILEQPYFNIGSIKQILYDVGSAIISYLLEWEKSIFFEPYNKRLEKFGINIKGLYLKKKGENSHEFYPAN